MHRHRSRPTRCGTGGPRHPPGPPWRGRPPTRRPFVAAGARYADPDDAHADRDFWALVVDASDNLAFRLALNSLLQAVAAQPEVMHELLAGNRRDTVPHADLARAIADGDADGAARCADAVLSQA